MGDDTEPQQMNERKPQAVERSFCPLCGNPNQCALAAGDLSQPCWCTGVTFPAAVLGQVPEVQQRVTCICRRCAEQGPGAVSK